MKGKTQINIILATTDNDRIGDLPQLNITMVFLRPRKPIMLLDSPRRAKNGHSPENNLVISIIHQNQFEIVSENFGLFLIMEYELKQAC